LPQKGRIIVASPDHIEYGVFPVLPITQYDSSLNIWNHNIPPDGNKRANVLDDIFAEHVVHPVDQEDRDEAIVDGRNPLVTASRTFGPRQSRKSNHKQSTQKLSDPLHRYSLLPEESSYSKNYRWTYGSLGHAMIFPNGFLAGRMAGKENGGSPKCLFSKPAGYGEPENFRREFMGSREKNTAGGIFPHAHKLTNRKFRKGGGRL
jgi:hypothetical protein